MIEAVNSVVANAAMLRGNADQSQQDRLSSIASNTQLERVEIALAPYVSPFIQVDNNFNKAVLQIRDSNTGDVVNQFPSETTMRARAAAAEIQNQQILSESLGRSSSRSISAPAAPSPSQNVQVEPLQSRSDNDIALAQSVASRRVQAQVASSALVSSAASSPSNASSSSAVSVFA
ncbi:MAG: hypothetical protein ACK4VI_01640 [Alphaproteobacteria bacterium]